MAERAAIDGDESYDGDSVPLVSENLCLRQVPAGSAHPQMDV
jgi:hypothetical protein